MFAKIFTQIFDSSVAENWHTRVVFQDLLILADRNGHVDMTHQAIARRTNVPLRIVRTAIKELEKADHESRTPEFEGRRLVRLDPHRTWGWVIPNYLKYRAIASEEQRRAKTADRTRNWRQRNGVVSQPIAPPVGNQTTRDAPVTPRDASDAMQRQRQKQREAKMQSAKGLKGERVWERGLGGLDLLEALLGPEFPNDRGKWINRWQENPGKVNRVAADLCERIKEQSLRPGSLEPVDSPAAFAETLWQQFA